MPTYASMTETQRTQHELEVKITKLYSTLVVDDARGTPNPAQLLLLRNDHAKYLYGGLRQLNPGYVCLDASRPWILFWVLHSLALLDAPYPDFFEPEDAVAFLSLCQHPDGGYGGGPHQLPHLATTYAAVSALVTLGTEEALASINRPGILDFLRRMSVGQEKGGGFYIHQGARTPTTHARSNSMHSHEDRACTFSAHACSRPQPNTLLPANPHVFQLSAGEQRGPLPA
jgi:protein farnesyltransferase subunit beta